MPMANLAAEEKKHQGIWVGRDCVGGSWKNGEVGRVFTDCWRGEMFHLK